MRLRDILDSYKKLIEMYEEVPLTPAEKIEEGGIYWLPAEQPLFLAVINDDGKYVDVAPVSFEWLLATRRDLIVEVPHLLSDRWIVQTDLTITAPRKLLKGAELIGKMAEEELEILKRAVEEKGSLPKERRGMGYEDPVHREFKDFEYSRYRFLLKELLSSIDEEEMARESSHRVISLPRFLVRFFEDAAQEQLAASSEKEVIPGEGVTAVLTSEGVKVAFDENLTGKRGKLKALAGGEEISLYEGPFPEVLTLKNLSPEAFRGIARLRAEVDE